MQSIYNKNQLSLEDWQRRQHELIDSFSSDPLIIILRISAKDLERRCFQSLFSLIKNLNLLGIKNIEIAWSNHKNWKFLIEDIKSQFKDISLGAASITNEIALEEIKELEFKYAMSPCWDANLQKNAKSNSQILIPGVFTPSEIQTAVNFGYRIIKLFPASSLGIKYLSQIKSSLQPLPFIIAAGGIKTIEINDWLNEGYGAIVLGRELIKNNQIDNELEKYFSRKNKT